MMILRTAKPLYATVQQAALPPCIRCATSDAFFIRMPRFCPPTTTLPYDQLILRLSGCIGLERVNQSTASPDDPESEVVTQPWTVLYFCFPVHVQPGSLSGSGAWRGPPAMSEPLLPVCVWGGEEGRACA
jgi:hypothetical protein